MAVCLGWTAAPAYLSTTQGFFHIKMEDLSAVMWAQQTGADTSVVWNKVSAAITLQKFLQDQLLMFPSSAKSTPRQGECDKCDKSWCGWAAGMSEQLLQPGLARRVLDWLCIPLQPQLLLGRVISASDKGLHLLILHVQHLDKSTSIAAALKEMFVAQMRIRDQAYTKKENPAVLLWISTLNKWWL